MLFKIKTYIILYPSTPYFSTLLKIKIHIGKFGNYETFSKIEADIRPKKLTLFQKLRFSNK